MKTTPFLEHILYDIFDERDEVTARAMMGGYVLYMEGKVFAIAEDETLWLKGSDILSDWYLSRGSKKFWYIKEGKIQGMNYFSVPEDVLENREDFKRWVEVALTVAMLPKSKSRK
jgi:DNA transformation protein and related proteins